MKRLLLALAILAALLPVADARMTTVVVSGSTGPTLFCDGVSGLLCEDFESDSACGDGSHTNCRVTWTVGGSWTDLNFNATGIDGDNSVYMDASSGVSTINKSFTASGTVYSSATYKISSLSEDSGVGNRVIEIDDADSYGNVVCGIDIKNVSGTYRISARQGAYTVDGSTFEVPSGSVIYLWWEYKKGSGDGYCKVYVSETDTKPETPEAQITSSSVNADARNLQILVWSGLIDEATIDNIYSSTTGF